MQVQGTAGSVKVTLKPAPQGIGLVTGDISKKVLQLAGIKDTWTFARSMGSDDPNWPMTSASTATRSA
jgi:ribosomal protein S5